MILDIKSTKGKNVKVYDAHGCLIGACYKYNTKTREVWMFLTGRTEKGVPKILCKLVKETKTSKRWATLKVKLKIPGSYAIVDGVKL